jgi:hypothetical protein
MYQIDIDIQLPKPWQNEKKFKTNKIGFINFLVGPNGTGKSRFTEAIKPKLPHCRILNSDRLAGFFFKQAGNSHFLVGGSNFAEGFNKSNFSHYKQGAVAVGIGGDAFVILEEKLDIRIRIEATLTQILNREIRLEWDSGRLVPKAYNIKQEATYELHKEECHGIKELLILLTHLYDDSHKTLVIDEPELNLHPQYQAFLLQEIRKVAGDPSTPGKKLIFLVTHSPFILDINNKQDLASIICFHSDFSEPSHLFEKSDTEISSFAAIIPRLNVHHKQLFFADCPIFVEGIFDAQFIKGIQEFRGVSMEGSGSCVIDVGGNSEIVLYHKLIESFGKKGKYVYDLDSIFTRALRTNADSDRKIKTFLAKIGAGAEFQKYCGELEKLLTKAIANIRKNDSENEKINELKNYLKKVLEPKDERKKKEGIKKARLSLLIHLDKYRQTIIDAITELSVIEIEGKLNNIIEALKAQEVFLLRGGALEHYLPSYTGNIYEISDGIKRQTIEKELEILFTALTVEELEERYGYLFQVIKSLPAEPKVDYLLPIKNHLGSLIYKIQKGIQTSLIKSEDTIPNYIGNEWNSYKRILEITSLKIETPNNFLCKIKIFDRWGLGELQLAINEKTNSGMGQFHITKT